MGSLQGPVFCPAVRARQGGLYNTVPSTGPVMKARLFRSELWGFKGLTAVKTKVGVFTRQQNARKCKIVQCTFSSSSNGNGSMAENFNENDEDFVNSSVVEAVEVKSGADGFMIKMRDGRHLRCVHNNPQGGHLPDYAPHPAIVLKMEDGTGLLLPIIVRTRDAKRVAYGGNAQCANCRFSTLAAFLFSSFFNNLRWEARPTLYQVVKEMIEKMGYEVGNETECVSFDLRPSDAINIAVRCKVPIQVNKYLAYSDGMRVVESGKLSTHSPGSDGLLFTELDKPSGQPCLDTKEFNLVRNMLIAAVEERYRDAAQWRDKLGQLRAKRNLRKFT
ncbi:Bifunctional nuclease 1 [Citrus sinensis]|uniref:Bifunctional nuclease 1 n=1 Tax=Citrus sinensis TaxID=2711 RepID=A0ACB8KWX3_CITSI|nr:Bifunctional nuclease 1 [Citrus sinensis]